MTDGEGRKRWEHGMAQQQGGRQKAPGQGGIDAPRVCGERERDEAGNVGGRKRGNGS